ncbi:MAG: HXXEE domain-containing protein [Paludibacteraceae bacterium]|nr:HXXEE domain-containing protein [Paludibacteraceae bacterium]
MPSFFTSLVLPFAFAFIIHDSEEIVFQHKWVLKNKEIIANRFPFLQKPLFHLEKMNTAAFAIAATEELFALITIALLVSAGLPIFIWNAISLAFSFHLVIHVAQGAILRRYVPGLVTSLVLLPYAYYISKTIFNAMSTHAFFLCGATGIIAMMVNLLFAHWLGQKLAR